MPIPVLRADGSQNAAGRAGLVENRSDHMRDCRLAVRAGDARDVERGRRIAVERGRYRGQRAARIGNAHDRRTACGKARGAIQDDRARAASDRVGDIAMTVGPPARDCDEEGARDDVTRIRGDCGYRWPALPSTVACGKRSSSAVSGTSRLFSIARTPRRPEALRHGASQRARLKRRPARRRCCRSTPRLAVRV